MADVHGDIDRDDVARVFGGQALAQVVDEERHGSAVIDEDNLSTEATNCQTMAGKQATDRRCTHVVPGVCCGVGHSAALGDAE